MKSLKKKLKKKHSLNNNPSTTLEKFTKTEDSVQSLSIHSVQFPDNPEKENISTSPKAPPKSSPNLFLRKKHLMSLTPVTNRKSSYFSVSASSSPGSSNKEKFSEKLSRKTGDGVSMTSFSSVQNLSQNNFSHQSNFESSRDTLPSTPSSLRNLSFSSSCSSQRSSTAESVSSSQTTNQLRSPVVVQRNKSNKKLLSASGSESLSDSHHSGFLKNLKIHKKEKSPVQKQLSKNKNSFPLRHTISLGDLTADSEKTDEILEQFKEQYKTLEIEVRGKDEEVQMLNATIDQVNQTWENRVRAVMKDLEQTKKHNEQLKERLQKENSASNSNLNSKTALRIPVKPMPKKQPGLFQQTKRNGAEDDAAVSKQNQIVSPRMNRKGIPEPTRKMGVSVRPGAKSNDVKQKLLQSLQTSPCLSQLSRNDLNCIAEVMKSKKIITGERLMQEGVFGQAFYVLGDADCRIFKQNQESHSPDLSNNERAMKPWEIFGEADVFYNTRRIWSCKCVRPGTVWFITREEFRSAIVQQDILQRQRKEILLFLNQVKSLEKLKKEDFKMLTTVSKVVHFAKGDCIIRQGSSMTSVYLLKEGEVTMTRIIDGSETRLETLTSGQFFGVSAAGNRHQHNVLASGKEVVQCVAIPSKNFNKIRDRVSFLPGNVTLTKINASLPRQNLEDGRESVSSDQTGSSSGYGSDPSTPNLRRKSQKRYDEAHSIKFAKTSSFLQAAKLKDFDTLALIGNGAFGSVSLVKINSNDENVFAVKKLSKQEVVAAEQQQNVFSEKTIQMESSRDCPFIVSLYSTFKDNRFVYFVMEFCPGGELFSLLSSTKAFDDDTARFYASCILEALAFLHSRRIVFRDLKPENVVLDRDGYCKLTDFGFAKMIGKSSSLRTYTYCGTPEYMAPETILYHAQSFPVDIWTLGIFIFEMLDGKAPFREKNRAALADLILGGIEPMLKRSREEERIVNSAASSIIKELCRIRPEDRLGYGKGGIFQVAKHSWFQKTNWQDLRQRKLSAPWKPKLRSLQDTRYFKPSSKCEQMQGAEEEFSGWDKNF